MTIYEIYDKSIKGLSVFDRLRLARLILDDAAPDDPMPVEEARAHLAQLIQDGIDSGPATPWTVDDVDRIKEEVRARSARRNAVPNA